ncbi:ovarian cancer G-protein coupled receptor 1-like [Micropterus salmoides]|uniref:ovarian cancer G-protein coupled receptor 1-like n=1 Tax=Micropterus salmoides TaxID=27706 RepID=UPI0018EDC663|nr:ovarian cancer G-protein coupled receptor 1-like [Micropterus salmoides]
MEGYYNNSTSQNQSYDYTTSGYQNYSNINNELTDVHKKVNFIIYVAVCIIIAFGLPLTLTAIYALYSMVRSDHVAPIYVINLLISDLIQLCYMIIQVAKPDDWNIEEISYYIYLSAVFASVYFMVCVSLERYLVIAHPLWYRYRRTIKTSVVVCVLVWTLPLAYFLTLYFWHDYVPRRIIFAIVLLLPFPLLIFFLVGTLRALSAAMSVHSDEKRQIVGILVLVLLIYTLLFLPQILGFFVLRYDTTLSTMSVLFLKLSPLADLVLYVFMRKGATDKLLASLCCCRIDSKDISSFFSKYRGQQP